MPVDIAEDYDGRVDVGGAAQRRTLPSASITKIAVGPYNNNSYLVRCTETGQALLIDAAAEPERLVALLGEILDDPRTDLAGILTTHAHPDHWQALAEVVEATGSPTLAGRLDAPEIPVSTDRLIDHGDVIDIGNLRFTTTHLQGHTEGSIVAILDDGPGGVHVFTGDCLFPGGVGKTWDDPDRFDSLLSGVIRELFDVLPDDATVYPGHGADTTIGTERPHLAEWRARGW